MLFERLKSLLSQTAIYGLSSVLGRLINFVLVPIHTAALSQAEFGINTDVYTLVAFLIVVTTYGMETAFFRFSEKPEFSKADVYKTSFLSILGSSIIFILFTIIAFPHIVVWMRYEDFSEFVVFMIVILSLDTLAAIPFAKLRSEGRALRFVSIKLTLIGVNVILNVFFFVYCQAALDEGLFLSDWISEWYNTEMKVQYIFISNLVASSVMFLMLIPAWRSLQGKFNWLLWRKLLWFSLPLLIGGLAGVANEMLDRQILKYLLPEDIAMAQLGIYGAVYKLSIFLVLFNQSFRYAAEPFFFSTEKENNSKETFAVVLRYFVVVMVIGFVFIVSFIDIFKHFIDEKFWEGLHILPILLLANIFLGINLNLSIWYKLIDKTSYGIIITGVGLVFTIGLNIYLVPKMGYEGAAWATLVSYTSMALTSFFLGQRFYRIPYQVGRILFYIILSTVASWLAWNYSKTNFVPQTLIFASFVGMLMLLERKQILKLKERFIK